MRLPGTIEERLDVIRKERRWLLKDIDIAVLEDDGIRVDCSLAGVTTCIQLRLEPNDIQFLRGPKCADFALLLDRGGDAFEAHVLELKKSVGEKEWLHVQEQLEWAVVRLLAIAGVLGIHIQAVTVYTVFCNDKLSRESAPDPAGMKIPVGTSADPQRAAAARRWAEARRSWEQGRVHLKAFARDIEHRRIPADSTGIAAVTCCPHPVPADHATTWRFDPAHP